MMGRGLFCTMHVFHFFIWACLPITLTEKVRISGIVGQNAAVNDLYDLINPSPFNTRDAWKGAANGKYLWWDAAFNGGSWVITNGLGLIGQVQVNPQPQTISRLNPPPPPGAPTQLPY